MRKLPHHIRPFPPGFKDDLGDPKIGMLLFGILLFFIGLILFLIWPKLTGAW